MTIASIAPIASVSHAAAMMQFQTAQAPEAGQTDAAQAIAPEHAPMQIEIMSPQTQVILEANATSRIQADQYDSRVLGATETVRSFDRIAMVEKGFEHMRELFEIANAPAGSGIDKRL
ncbi:hypothetical protein [Meridianimarinicoccus aquatilis]|uniref:Uncharacterized protein n=1 Tax=Meridianimarinicoccus aquatilis TaxID=2552766 RepID=A0A4R6AYX6_9RHOB|nr:hypothetical protein [Fluviibacterium aquatile]TDL89457.1 hypothetical protein E2L05_06190 [Fluviibacterium aquatile]